MALSSDNNKSFACCSSNFWSIDIPAEIDQSVESVPCCDNNDNESSPEENYIEFIKIIPSKYFKSNEQSAINFGKLIRFAQKLKAPEEKLVEVYRNYNTRIPGEGDHEDTRISLNSFQEPSDHIVESGLLSVRTYLIVLEAQQLNEKMKDEDYRKKFAWEQKFISKNFDQFTEQMLQRIEKGMIDTLETPFMETPFAMGSVLPFDCTIETSLFLKIIGREKRICFSGHITISQEKTGYLDPALKDTIIHELWHIYDAPHSGEKTAFEENEIFSRATNYSIVALEGDNPFDYDVGRFSEFSSEACCPSQECRVRELLLNYPAHDRRLLAAEFDEMQTQLGFARTAYGIARYNASKYELQNSKKNQQSEKECIFLYEVLNELNDEIHNFEEKLKHNYQNLVISK